MRNSIYTDNQEMFKVYTEQLKNWWLIYTPPKLPLHVKIVR